MSSFEGIFSQAFSEILDSGTGVLEVLDNEAYDKIQSMLIRPLMEIKIDIVDPNIKAQLKEYVKDILLCFLDKKSEDDKRKAIGMFESFLKYTSAQQEEQRIEEESLKKKTNNDNDDEDDYDVDDDYDDYDKKQIMKKKGGEKIKVKTKKTKTVKQIKTHMITMEKETKKEEDAEIINKNNIFNPKNKKRSTFLLSVFFYLNKLFKN